MYDDGDINAKLVRLKTEIEWQTSAAYVATPAVVPSNFFGM